MELAVQTPGFLGVESARGTDGFGITVSYWKSEEDALYWKQNSEHMLAQRLGKQTWYQDYCIRVAKVKRSYTK
jgi:heme-degrading monooxygenase HmoA